MTRTEPPRVHVVHDYDFSTVIVHGSDHAGRPVSMLVREEHVAQFVQDVADADDEIQNRDEPPEGVRRGKEDQ